MQQGDRLGDLTIVDLLAPGLARGTNADGGWLVRAGEPKAVERAFAVAELLDLPTRLAEDGSWFAMRDGGEPLEGLFDERNVGRVRTVFRHLAEQVARVHEAGLLFGTMQPAAVRVSGTAVRIVPAVEVDPMWSAPEGRSRAGDWYAFGLLLWGVLMRGEPFGKHGQDNAPDPRDRFADAPGDLCALAMDLVLLEPSERGAAADVREVLAQAAMEALPTETWLSAALDRGGVEVRTTPIATALRDLNADEVVGLQENPRRLLRIVRHAEALSAVDRARATTLLTDPDVLEPGALERAGALLAIALSTSGVRVLWVVVSDATRWDVLHAVIRGDAAPLVLLEGDVSPAFLERCSAEGVPGVFGPTVDELAFVSREDPALVAGLAELGVTAAGPPWGRWIERWEHWRTPATIDAATSDGSVNREIHRLSSPLVWTETARLRSAGAQLRRRCVAAGDVDGAWSAAQLLAWSGSPEPAVAPRSDRARGWQRLARAIRYRQEGHPARVEGVLAGELPLQVGPDEDAMGTLLLAEALFQRARWHRARRLLRQLRVDARLQGVEEWDAAAVALLVRMGHSPGALEGVEDGGWVGRLQLRAWIDVHLQAGRVGQAAEVAHERMKRLERWPEGHPAVGRDARLLYARLRGLAGGAVVVPTGHPASPAWKEVVRAGEERRAGNLVGVQEALREASHRFDGSNRTLEALASARVRGLFLGGVRGGTLVEQADKALGGAGVDRIPRVMRSLLPELILPV